MASQSFISGTARLLLLVAAISCFLHCVSCVEFQVGDRIGWVVPPTNDTKLYNEWASQKRFTVGDTVGFKYKKDSVMEVNKTNYESCNSTRPNYFSNTGDTTYTLKRSGFFYFISGTAGHCEMGQKMIIWVIERDAKSDSDSKSKSKSGGNSSKYSAVLSFGVVFAMVPYLVSYL